MFRQYILNNSHFIFSNKSLIYLEVMNQWIFLVVSGHVVVMWRRYVEFNSFPKPPHLWGKKHRCSSYRLEVIRAFILIFTLIVRRRNKQSVTYNVIVQQISRISKSWTRVCVVAIIKIKEKVTEKILSWKYINIIGKICLVTRYDNVISWHLIYWN